MTFSFGRSRRGRPSSQAQVVGTLRRGAGRASGRFEGLLPTSQRYRDINQQLVSNARLGRSIAQSIRSLRTGGFKISNDHARILHRLASNRKLTARQETIAGRLVEQGILEIDDLDLDVKVRVSWKARVDYRVLYEQSGAFPTGEFKFETDGENILNSARNIKSAIEVALFQDLQNEANQAAEQQTGLPSYVVSGIPTNIVTVIEKVQAA